MWRSPGGDWSDMCQTGRNPRSMSASRWSSRAHGSLEPRVVTPVLSITSMAFSVDSETHTTGPAVPPRGRGRGPEHWPCVARRSAH